MNYYIEKSTHKDVWRVRERKNWRIRKKWLAEFDSFKGAEAFLEEFRPEEWETKSLFAEKLPSVSHHHLIAFGIPLGVIALIIFAGYWVASHSPVMVHGYARDNFALEFECMDPVEVVNIRDTLFLSGCGHKKTVKVSEVTK